MMNLRQKWQTQNLFIFLFPTLFAGSGIYAPDSPRAFHYDRKTQEGKLLLSQLDSHPRHSAVNWTSYASSIEAPSTGNQEFQSIAFFDEFTFVELKGITGNYTVCQNDLCCHLSYQMSEKRADEVYALGAFDGLHTVEGQYYLQVMSVSEKSLEEMHTAGKNWMSDNQWKIVFSMV